MDLRENFTTLGGTEPHDSSWQCKKSHCCCCHGPLALLAMGDSGTSTVLTQYKSMRLRSLRKSERTTARGPSTTQEMNLSLLWGGQYTTSTKMGVVMVYDAFQTFGKKFINKTENYMPSGVLRFGLWLWEWTACRCKNIDLQICSEVIYCESEMAELVYMTKWRGNKPTFLSSAVWM